MGRRSGQESDRGTGFVRSVLYPRRSESTSKVTKRSRWDTVLDNVMHEKLGWKNFIKEYKIFGKNFKLYVANRSYSFLCLQKEIHSNIHSRLDDLDFLRRTIYDMS